MVVDMAVEHIPVLFEESLELLQVRPGGIYVDGTVGLGGHSEGILARLEGQGFLIGLDVDPEALGRARERLAARYSNFELYPENFKNLPEVLTRFGFQKANGCLLDLGLSSLQLGSPGRGFGIRDEGPLDMRMDPRLKLTAAHLVNQWSEAQLADLFRRHGEEPASRRIAAAIVARRQTAPIGTTLELAELVEQVKGRSRNPRIHPATQIFQALRIEVNQELTRLAESLEEAIGHLAPGGRLVVISFHSLEDRIVKRVFRREAGFCVCFRPPEVCTCPRVARVRLLTRKPMTPSSQEVQRNPRSRSARLRAVEVPVEETSHG